MSDSTDPATQPPTSEPTPTPSQYTGPEMTAGEVAEGKAFAILCYAINFVGFPFWLLPIIMRNNDFSLYHAKQCLLLWIVLVAAGVVVVIPCLGWVVFGVAWIAVVVFNVMGLINAMNGMCKPLPVVGKFAEQWFAGLRKVPK